MSDRMNRKGISIDAEKMEELLQAKVVLVSARKNEGIDALKQHITSYKNISTAPCVSIASIDQEYFSSLERTFPNQSLYKLWLVITQDVNFARIERQKMEAQDANHMRSRSFLKRLQQKETIKRYQYINNVLKACYNKDNAKATDLRGRLDRILTHKVWGFVIFFLVPVSYTHLRAHET